MSDDGMTIFERLEIEANVRAALGARSKETINEAAARIVGASDEVVPSDLLAFKHARIRVARTVLDTANGGPWARMAAAAAVAIQSLPMSDLRENLERDAKRDAWVRGGRR